MQVFITNFRLLSIYLSHNNGRSYLKQILLGLTVCFLIFLPVWGHAQDSAKLVTKISGKVVDAASGQPLPSVSIKVTGSKAGTSTNNTGDFELYFPGSYKTVKFDFLGYQQVTKEIRPGQANTLFIKMRLSQTLLKEVKVSTGAHKKYRNKGNPAVELIQEVINHKPKNRPEGANYLQYDQYERIRLYFYDLPAKLINGRLFRPYQFMLDSSLNINGNVKIALPIFFNEKLSKYYFRKEPEKTISVLTAEKQTNIIKFIDTAGLDIYLNRLYGNKIDIYDNNIFVLVNQFLSPISDHSPDFYKFFIADTIQVGKEKLVELNFTPRNKGDILFEGKILVTLDGRYAVASCELNINKHINVNFVRSLKINLDFAPDSGFHYYLKRSDVTADFGLFKDKGAAIFGERSVFYSNYKINQSLPGDFYKGKSLQIQPNIMSQDTSFWARHRTDTLSRQEALVYTHMNRLEKMASFKRATWIASTFTGGYANTGPVEIGPIGQFYSFSPVEGSRFQLGGRTTPTFNKWLYFAGSGAYGVRDKLFKENLSTYFSLNKTPFYRFPNDYFRINYIYDVNVPGYNYAITKEETGLNSFYSGKSDFFVYSKIFSVDYVKDFENHFSYDINIRNWDQHAAGILTYQYNDQANTPINNLVTTEASLSLRYAPHEQIVQGTEYRRTIHSKYPIFNLKIDHGFKGLLEGSYNFTSFDATITKRFYFSQLGYADVTFLGNYLAGKVPFPLLNISPANQSYAYDPDAYNGMDYLEFVSDHYAGVNLTQSFNGFFLNKIPLISHLKWREFLSFKVLYGGLRNENNPLYAPNLYQFPLPANGTNGTYALGNTPYIEIGAGIGNIFKFLRIDVIHRYNYLDHPNIAPYGIKFSIQPDF